MSESSEFRVNSGKAYDYHLNHATILVSLFRLFPVDSCCGQIYAI